MIDGQSFHRFAETTKHLGTKKTAENRKNLEVLLKDIAFFKNLTNEQKEMVLERMFRVPVKAGDIVVHQGAHGDYFYVIEDGSFQIFVSRPGKFPKLVDTLSKGSAMGHLSLLYNIPRAASIKCEKDGVLWALGRDSFLEAIGPGSDHLKTLFEKNADIAIGKEKFMSLSRFLSLTGLSRVNGS